MREIMSNIERIPLLEESLTPAEQARLYKHITDKGFEYIPWIGREEEFRNSYVVLESAPMASRVNAWYCKSEYEREALRESLERWDASVTGDEAMAWYPEQREVERTAIALVNYHLSWNEQDRDILRGATAFQRLPRSIEVTPPIVKMPKKSFLSRIFT